MYEIYLAAHCVDAAFVLCCLQQNGGNLMPIASAKDGVIHIRIARDEKHRLFETARRRGMTLSAFLRDTATEFTWRR
jgi:hypothetical protein